MFQQLLTPPMAWPARIWRLMTVTVLGFASGLPLALTGQALQAWMSVEGLDLATIGFLSLVGLPYTFKFLWAPLVDRFELPLLGRRRGWMVLSQLLLAAALWALAQTSPVHQLKLYAGLAVLVAVMPEVLAAQAWAFVLAIRRSHRPAQLERQPQDHEQGQPAFHEAEFNGSAVPATSAGH